MYNLRKLTSTDSSCNFQCDLITLHCIYRGTFGVDGWLIFSLKAVWQQRTEQKGQTIVWSCPFFGRDDCYILADYKTCTNRGSRREQMMASCSQAWNPQGAVRSFSRKSTQHIRHITTNPMLVMLLLQM